MTEPSHASDVGSMYVDTIRSALAARRRELPHVLERLDAQSDRLSEAAALLVDTLRSGGTVLLAGNGGSAAEAQHFSAELVGRYRRERSAYAAIALTTDSSILTAIGNDYSYEDVFSRQVEGLGRSGDLLICFSTSGESENLVRAAAMAHERGMRVIAVTGERESRLSEAADLALRMPTRETPVVQELHMMMTHLLCDIAEEELSGLPGPLSRRAEEC